MGEVAPAAVAGCQGDEAAGFPTAVPLVVMIAAGFEGWDLNVQGGAELLEVEFVPVQIS